MKRPKKRPVRKSKAKAASERESELNRQVNSLEAEIQRVARQRDSLRQFIRPMTLDAFLMYKQQLGDLLTDEQRAHADISGVSHDQYAMQLIRLCNMKISEMSHLR